MHLLLHSICYYTISYLLACIPFTYFCCLVLLDVSLVIKLVLKQNQKGVFLDYTLAFFGTILSVSLIWRIAAGDFPKGIPFAVLWTIALAFSFYIGYRRFYLRRDDESSGKAGSKKKTKAAAKPAKS